MWAQNMYAANAIGFSIRQDLDRAIDLAQRAGPAVGTKRKYAFAILDTLLFELFLSFANRSDLRLGIDNASDGIVIHMTVSGGQVFDAGNPFFFSLVRQQRSPNHVTNRVDSRYFGCKTLVDRNESLFVEFQTKLVQPQPFRIRHTPDGDQH